MNFPKSKGQPYEDIYSAEYVNLNMGIVNKLMMLTINVSDIPKTKAFFADKLGLKVATDYRQDDDNW
jgi:hypothetical protein